MNKTLQDNVWSILPKEFKKEVKRMWSVEVDCATKYHSELHKHRVDLLYELFGEHLHWQNNFTSDAEGEEMLTVSRKEVQEMYSAFEEFKDKDNTCFNLETLFGSKCLWDETCNVASKESNPSEEDDVFNDPEPKCLYFKDGKCAHPAVAHLENGKLVKGADCDVSSCEDVEYEPKPAEPKFKEGDRAIYCIPEKQRIKARVVNVRQRSGSTLFNTLFNYDIRLDDGRTANWVDEQWLLPDNDDQVRAVTEKDSEQFDRIIKGGFRNERRLNIAAMAMQGILSNADRMKKYEYVATEPPYAELEVVVARKALRYADTLIAECEKGGEEE